MYMFVDWIDNVDTSARYLNSNPFETSPASQGRSLQIKFRVVFGVILGRLENHFWALAKSGAVGATVPLVVMLLFSVTNNDK
jgi:hypothetical protein